MFVCFLFGDKFYLTIFQNFVTFFDKTTNANKHPKQMSSEYIRFMISGLIGTALFYVVYEGIHRFLHLSPALCWFFAYLLSILWQMELHARIVYKTKINNYAATLVQTYLAYGLSIV